MPYIQRRQFSGNTPVLPNKPANIPRRIAVPKTKTQMHPAHNTVNITTSKSAYTPSQWEATTQVSHIICRPRVFHSASPIAVAVLAVCSDRPSGSVLHRDCKCPRRHLECGGWPPLVRLPQRHFPTAEPRCSVRARESDSISEKFLLDIFPQGVSISNRVRCIDDYGQNNATVED
jgi:hypothetical protein